MGLLNSFIALILGSTPAVLLAGSVFVLSLVALIIAIRYPIG